VQDVDEWMEVTGVPGIPIAIDDSKGTYYLPFGPLRRGDSAPILLRAPGPSRTDIEVAPSLEDFLRFQPVEAGVEDSEEQKEQKGKRR